MTSVRARTTALAALVVAVTLAVGAIVLLSTLEHSLTSNRDALSRARAVDLANQVITGTLPRVLTDIGEDFVGQVVAADGTVLAASSGILGQPAISTVAEATSTPTLRTLRDVPDDEETEDYRVWVLRAATDSGPVTILVGASLESVNEAVGTLRQALLVGVPVMLALLALATRVLVGRALRPVEDIRAEVAAITDRELDRRVPTPATSDEIGRLARTMNEMLDRLESAAARQQEFVADASHELQSPLAAFRVQLEVAMAHPDDVDWATLTRDLLADSDRMERLVRDLLFLAQEDAGSDPPRTDPVDLDVIVIDEVARLRQRAPLRFDTSNVSAAPLQGNRDDLARLVRNLLDNAAVHAGSQVTVELSASPSSTRLAICDDGPGVPVEHRERVFERFTRVEGARAREPAGTSNDTRHVGTSDDTGLVASSGGTGLGLAIARVIAERHGGSIGIETSPRFDSGACLVVELPLRPTNVPREEPSRASEPVQA